MARFDASPRIEGALTFLVQKVQRLGDVPHHQACLLLRQRRSALDVGEQRPALHLLEDEVEAVVLFEVLDQLQHVLVSLAVVENLHFLEHLRPAPPTPLVDDLK